MEDQAYYTYRISIANTKSVQVTKSDPNGTELGHPQGLFRYRGKNRTRIQELHQAARKGELVDANVQELGEKLFTVLFDDVLKRDFFSLYEQVRDEEALLRLELDVDESQLPEVAALPWEFMCVRSNADYGMVWLGTEPNLIFSRRRELWKAPKPIRLKEGERLRIALVVAAPDKLGPVRYETIWQELQNLTSKQAAYVDLLSLVNSATPFEIDKILKRKPHIFHFIGHAELKHEDQRDIAQIALADDTSSEEPYWVGAEQFSELFTRHRPGVVLLQACEGGMLSAAEAFVGVASYVVQQKIPVVVAMQYEVSNVTAQQFALEFYRCLAHNDPVDTAAQEGRRRISLGPVGHCKRDFATPVLFMRVKDGKLFLSPLSNGSDDQDFIIKMKRIQGALLEEQRHFNKGQVIYRDGCDPSINALKELDEFLEHFPINITQDYSLTVPISNVISQEKDLRQSLDAFRSICPPSKNYNNVSKQYYDDKCEAVSVDLNELVESINKLIARLEKINN